MKCVRLVLLLAVVATALSAVSAFAWGPNTHGRMALNALNYPTITSYLNQYGLSASTIAGEAWECDLPGYRDTYHFPQWETVRDQLWLTDPKWNNLDETRKLAFLCHLACDSGVPMSHSPANEVWTNTTIEAALEARVDTWSTSPGITPYTGTYADKMNTFHSQEISLAQWTRSNVTSAFEATFLSHGKTAGWSGVTYGQNLCEAMLEQYFVTRGGGLMMASSSLSSMSSVPEPASMSILLMGALSLLGWCRWKRSAA